MSRLSIFIPVHWLTDFGGLHENVFDTVRAFREAAWRVVVMAPRAKFNARFAELGADLIENDMTDVPGAVRLVLGAGPYDLVHAHPFAGRLIGATVASECRARLALTIHGQYLDDLVEDHGKYDGVIAVCEQVASYIRHASAVDASRLHVIPNAVDADTFKPSVHAALKRMVRRSKVITVASRLDPDKVTLFRCVSDLVEHLVHPSRSHRYEIRFHGQNFYGDTSPILQPLLERARGAGLRMLMAGWLSDRESLAGAFRDSDIVIASGRAAMEALACGRPTIAVASRGYVGPLLPEMIDVAIRTNFGGFETEQTTYRSGDIVSGLEKVEILSRSDLRVARKRMLSTHSAPKISQLHRDLAEQLARACRRTPDREP